LITICALFPNIESLKLDGANITDAGLDAVSKLKKLKWIWLNALDVTELGCYLLQKVKTLEKIAHPQSFYIPRIFLNFLFLLFGREAEGERGWR
jgi:hypothetical protein